MRRGRLGLVIVVAVIGLGGCWGTKVDFGVDRYYVTVNVAKSNQTIKDCVKRFPASTSQQAGCTMDTIRAACHSDPIGWAQCDAFTEHRSSAENCKGSDGVSQPCIKSMMKAIAAVKGAQECLTLEHSPEGIGPSRLWIGSDDTPGNALSCG